MTYLLDTMIISYFLQAQREDALARAAALCRVAIVDEVRRELEVDTKRGGRPFTRWLSASGIVTRAIEVGSPAHSTLVALVGASSTNKNLGERASIALAASDSSLTFVSNDTNGLRLALREIWAPGERILGIAVFLRRLVEQGAVDDLSALDDVMKIVVNSTQLQSTWWASWRAGLAAASAASPVAT